jgi:hypothetical protein
MSFMRDASGSAGAPGKQSAGPPPEPRCGDPEPTYHVPIDPDRVRPTLVCPPVTDAAVPTGLPFAIGLSVSACLNA